MPRATEDPVPSEEKVSRTNIHTTNIRNNSALAALLIAIAVLLVATLLGGAFALGRHSVRSANDRSFFYGNSRRTMMNPMFGGNQRVGSYINTSDRVVGVVTQVNGDHFTVASNGATKDVQTNSSTQYSGGSSVKVNDSVLVFGTTDNNQFTASQIVVNP